MVSKNNNIKKPKSSLKISQSSRYELEQYIEASNDAVRVLNSDFTIRYINQAFAEMTGVNQDEVVRKVSGDISQHSLLYRCMSSEPYLHPHSFSFYQ
jgi:PAS domain-containing protein